MLVEADLLQLEATQLGHAEAGAVQDLEYGVVATLAPYGLVVGRSTIEQLADRVLEIAGSASAFPYPEHDALRELQQPVLSGLDVGETFE